MAHFDLISLLRGGQGYVIDNFLFIKKDIRGPVTRLRCQMYEKPPKGRTCSASANIRNGAAYIVSPNHNHPAPCLEAARFREQVLAESIRPANARVSVGHIYNVVRNEVSPHKRSGVRLRPAMDFTRILTMYKFITVLLQYGQSVAYDFDVRSAAGNPNPRARRRYRTVDAAIHTFHNNILRYNTAQYLRGLANMAPAPMNM